jgi:CrcB protein
MKIILAIGAGSFIGGISRYLLSTSVNAKYISAFPIGTMLVNITGCLLIGVVYGFVDKGMMSSDWKLFLATGLLGGFTTFSAFSIETVGLLRVGQFGYAAAYVSASVIIGLLATVAGIFLVKFL